MNKGDEVTLSKDIPLPEEWSSNGRYSFENSRTGNVVHEKTYYELVEKRNTLATYIEEVDPYPAD